MTGSPSPKNRSSALYSGVVLYDAGSKSREALTFGFEREDFEVFSTDQPNEALSLLDVSGSPILAVSIGADDDERASALSFIGQLRERDDKKKSVAVVVLGRRDLREDALRAGADEFVAWPAFIRDAVTLARLAIANRPDGAGVTGLLEDYEVYFLVRALAAAGRSAVVELERAGHKGSLHFARGELVAARVGRLSGIGAFQHLLLWGEATMKLHFASPPGERKIHAPVDELLQAGVRFVEEFERLAARVGGPQATFERRDKDLGDPKVPTEVRRFAETMTSGATLVDLVESSPFKPFDTIKVCYRLCELGLAARRDPVRSISPLTAQLAVRDWLLGATVQEPRSTVTEAGRRAAEAYAEAAAQRAEKSVDPSEEIFGADTTDRLTPLEPKIPEPVIEATVEAPIEDRPTAKKATKSKVEPEIEQTDKVEKLDPPPKKADAPVSKKADVVKKAEALKKAIQQPAAKVAAKAVAEAPAKQPVFDDLDEEFFAKESELHIVEPVDTFDDLDLSARHKKLSPKKKWSLFGEQPTPTKKKR